jgi:DNA-binding NarL/FixJ family response regulator
MCSVLVVDDHASFRVSARAFLEGEGFPIVGEAIDGASALAAVAETNPDVVLLDVQLPDLSGFEVAAALRAAGHPARVVLTSTREASEYGDLIDASPAAGFIAKDALTGDAIRALLT